MKTIFTTLLLTFATFASASVNPIDLVIQADPTSHTLVVRTTASVKDATKVQIIDATGIVLHTAKLDSGEFLNGRFQMSALPVGTYEVVATDRTGKTIQPFSINREGISADPSLASRSFYPAINLKDQLLTVNYLNTNGRKVDIRMSDKEGNQIISDRLPGTTTLQRAYSLEQLPAGEYYVTVSSPNTLTYTTSLVLE